MAKAYQRAGALIIAILFFATAVAFSVVVILQSNNQDKPSTSEIDGAALQEALNQEEGNENMLKGTKLANFTPVEVVNELQVIDLKEGDGAAVGQGATVVAHYTGALAKDGTIFESSKDGGTPAEFPLSGVIAGWQEGVPGMKVGGVRRLIIPANLAYGEQGSPPTIGPNEPLVFDIEMVEVK